MSLKPPADPTNSVPSFVDTFDSRLDDLEAETAGIVSVTDPTYGAAGDGIADDTAEIQAAINAAYHTSTPSTVLFPPGTYLVTGLTLPNLASGDANYWHMRLSGYGATLKSTTGNTILGRNLPADSTAAGIDAKGRFTIEGFRFLGNSTASQKGLVLPCSYGSVIRDCSFLDVDTGMELIFALNARVESCLGRNNASYAFVVKSGNGLWTGASVANSASNVTTFSNCRDYCSTGQDASWLIQGSDFVELNHCISEGLNPVEAVRFEHQSNAREFRMTDFWLENFPTGTAAIHAPAFNRVILDGIHLSTGHGVILNADGSAVQSVIDVRDVPFWPTATAKWRHSTVDANQQRWVFRNVGSDSNDMAASTYWDTSAAGFAPNLVEQHHMDSTLMGARHPVANARRYGIKAADDIRLSAVNGVRIGDGSSAGIKTHLTGTAAWDPADTASGAMTSTTVTVTGAVVGNPVDVGFSVAVPAGVLLVGNVTAADTVTVTLFNISGGNVNLASGTLRACVWKY